MDGQFMEDSHGRPWNRRLTVAGHLSRDTPPGPPSQHARHAGLSCMSRFWSRFCVLTLSSGRLRAGRSARPPRSRPPGSPAPPWPAARVSTEETLEETANPERETSGLLLYRPAGTPRLGASSALSASGREVGRCGCHQRASSRRTRLE